MSTAAEFPPISLHPSEAFAKAAANVTELDPNSTPPLPERWRFSHELAELEPLRHEMAFSHGERVGEIAVYRAAMEDGSVYEVRDARPRHQQIDTAMLKTTAFMTRHDRGMNLHHQHRDLRLGFRSVLISRELDWQGPLDQGRTAYNMARIVKPIIEGDGSVDPVNVELTGLSRGQMLAFGVKAMTEQMPELGLNCFYINGVGPCFPKPLKIGLSYARFPLTEGPSLAYHLTKLPARLLLKYPGTVDADKAAMRANARALVGGDAGEFVNFIPKERDRTNGFVLVLPDDVMSMGKVWQDKFREHKGMRIEMAKPGRVPLTDGHLRIFNYADLLAFEERQIRLVNESRGIRNVAELDFDYINGDENHPVAA